MKTINTLLFFLLIVIKAAHSQETTNLTETTENASSLGLSALVGYNFNGQGDIKNLAPEVFLGWREKFEVGSGKVNSIGLRVGADVSSTGKNKEVTDFARSLMLPGNGGFNGVLTFLHEGNGYQQPGLNLYANLALGVKVLSGLKDSTANISQHNFRLSGGFQFKNLFSLTVQHTWGRHNLTTESEKAFKNIFNQKSTKISYISINLQSQLSEGINIFATYRILSGKSNLPDLDNNKIITIGLRKDIDFLSFVGPGAQPR